MTESSSTRATIEAFVNLAMARRRHAVSVAEKARMQALEDELRDALDGARPAPKQIENPAPETRRDNRPVMTSQNVEIRATPSQRAAPTRPASIEPEPLAPARTAPKQAERAKVNDAASRRSGSGYTPPIVPVFMQDYYSEALVPAQLSPQERPKKVVAIDGLAPGLSPEARHLFGIGRTGADRAAPTNHHRSEGSTDLPRATREDSADRPRASTRARPSPAKASPRRATAPVGPQVLVSLLDGSSVRGHLPHFDPNATTVDVDQGGQKTTLPLEGVLAIFFRAKANTPRSPSAGTPVTVLLVNDRKVEGVTPDYQTGGRALTVVPDHQHPSLDRVWIPAWAVKAIEMDDVDG